MTFSSGGTIAGRLYSDSNGDNTENNGTGGYEAGLGGLRVELYKVDYYGNKTFLGYTTTDSNGAYEFNNLSTYSHKSYVVKFPTEVNGEGLVTQNVGSENEDSDANQNTGFSDPISVPYKSGSDTSAINVDAGYSHDVAPDGAVDGEAFGEVMELGYDDSNAPTDQGGDKITDGDDLIYGNGGDDTIDGAGGDDTIYGGSGGEAGFNGPRESFNWEKVTGGQADSTVTQDTGTVEVTYTRTADTGHHQSDVDNSTNLNTAGIDTGGEAIDTNSSLFSETGGKGNTGKFQWEFSEVVGNLEFNINDLDGDGLVTVTAYDADNNPIEVVLTGGKDIKITGNVADANGPYQNVNDPDTSVNVSIAGPVSRVVVEHTQNGYDNSGIHITDMYFDTGYSLGDDGNDVITGGAGADEMYGEGGDDTFIVSSGEDGNCDTVVGGNGPDDTKDNDTLDLRGAGQVTIVDSVDDSDAGARKGTVTFENGAVLEFSQIETILTDPQRDGVVDGEETGEVMNPGYDDSNGPTDGGGDIIDGPDGLDDVIEGNGGDDTINAGLGDDTVDGGTGADVIVGGAGTDSITGGQGDDDIAVGGNDSAWGGSGDDEFTIDGTDPASDIDVTIDGGSDGTDGNPDGPENGDEGDILNLGDRTEDLTVVLDGADPENGTVNGLDGDAGTDISFTEIERIVTGSGNDTIDAKGADGGIDVETGAGDDSVDGGNGDDRIDTGYGNDTVISGDGSDTVESSGGDNYIDTSKNSALPLPDDGFPSYGPFPTVPADADPNDDRDLVNTGAGNDTIYTGDDNDTINAGAGDNYVDGGLDDDEITTLWGNDTIVGGEGNDTISSGAGDDLIYGGLDPNVVPFDQVNIPDAPDGGSFGPDPDENNGRDWIDAGAGNDTVYGQDDDDTIYGGGGSDLLDGGNDDDLIHGGNGRDTIYGGQGADTMYGEAGSDEFRFDEREHAFGDEIDGGTEDGDNDPTTDNENDQLDLRGLGRFEIVQSDGFTPLDLTTPNDPDGNSFTGQVNFLDADGNVEGSLKFTEIEDIIPCFTPGTVIATPKGERLVEELREGDKIITRDNGLQEIRWVGRRDLTGRDLASAPHLQPVLIRAGSLGHGLPERDMMVSPQHRLLINNEKSALYFEDREVLAAAKHLTGMEGVASVEASSVSYIHFMFDRHEVVLSNGAWTESFQPGETVLDDMGDAQRDEIFSLFPELAEKEGIEAYTAARRSLKKHEARLLVK